MTLRLSPDSFGCPAGFEVLPGNISEPKTLAGALRRLSGSGEETVVMDAGIMTEANPKWLREEGYGWITVSRTGRPVPPERAPDVTVRTRAKHEVRAWKLEEEDGEPRLCAVSEGRKATENGVLARRRQKFEAELTRLHEGPTTDEVRPGSAAGGAAEGALLAGAAAV